MKNSKVSVILFATILTMTVIPLAAAFYLLENSVNTSLSLGFNQQVVDALEIASQNLKRLKTTDAENQSHYKDQFEEIENLKVIYSQPELVKSNILESLKIYFGIGLLAAVFASVAIATLLSRQIARSYAVTFDELLKQKKKVRYLEEIATWQDLAKMLAHEIKNPLTPIEVLITSLTKSYPNKSAKDFNVQLTQTEAMIREEVGHLKNIVNRFNEFSKVQKVELRSEKIIVAVQQIIRTLSSNHHGIRIEFDYPESLSEVMVKIDLTLFRQVLSNLVRNGIEANPERLPNFRVSLADANGYCQISISNDGVPVPKELGERIFDPYISSKTGSENMGLGLAIVKKIITEHGGEISYAEIAGQPTFVISIRRLSHV